MNNIVVLPVNSNQKMNAYLKEIAEVCGIYLNFTGLIAKHIFATTVSKMLGHFSINMTRIYARLLDKKVVQDMKYLNNKYKMSEVE